MSFKNIIVVINIFYSWFAIIGFLSFNNAEKAASRTFHPFFVSVTEIQHNAKEKTLEVSCKIFSDDLEKTLRQNYPGKVDLLNPADKNAMNKLIADYIKKHLQIVADGKLLNMQFIGYEREEEAIWSYFQVTNIAAPKKVDVNDNILYEYKKEEINLLHITVNGVRKSTKLDNPESKAIVTF